MFGLSKYLISLVLVSGLLAVASSSRAQQPQQPPAPVQTAIAKEMMMAPAMELPGTIVSRNDSRIATEVAGRVEWVAEVGTVVEAGDPVARLDTKILELERATNRANVKRLEARLGYERKQVNRFRELLASNTTPAQRVDEAEANRDMTEQELNSARVALERSEVLLARATIKAPFPGRVVERFAQQGEYVTTGQELARLVDTVHLEVRAMAPLLTAGYIADGEELTVRSDDATQGAYAIRTIIPVADEVSRTVELRVPVPANKWVIGAPVRVTIPTGGPREVTAVHRDALILRRENTYIFKIGEDAKASRVVVEPGAASGDYIEVLGPVSAGDEVIIRGAERLRDGQTVQVLENRS